jgi:hypothetical protein
MDMVWIEITRAMSKKFDVCEFDVVKHNAWMRVELERCPESNSTGVRGG